jgi:hypothetical protein
LITPANGAVTGPLQRHAWPSDGEASRERSPGDSAQPAPFDWNNLQILSPDRSLPNPVSFAWERPEVGMGPLTYELLIARSAGFEEPVVSRGCSRTKADVWHLHLGRNYCWKVIARRFRKQVAESAIWRFTTNSEPPRWIMVPGITNVRDIGGWPLPGYRIIRQGLIYRGSEMNGSLMLTARGRRVLEEELGIRTDIDLRGAGDASPALSPDKVQWIHIPISPYDSICDDAFKQCYRRIFEIFADASRYPIIFHCVGGADRGGTVAFLLNALLGKDKEHLFLDYELTSLSIWGERSRLSEQFNSLLLALRPFADDPDDVNRQVETYLLSIGVRAETIAAIRSRLIADRE